MTSTVDWAYLSFAFTVVRYARRSLLILRLLAAEPWHGLQDASAPCSSIDFSVLSWDLRHPAPSYPNRSHTLTPVDGCRHLPAMCSVVSWNFPIELCVKNYPMMTKFRPMRPVTM